jgi:hypothetical protein
MPKRTKKKKSQNVSIVEEKHGQYGQELPLECWSQIISFLSVRAHCAIVSVCKILHDVGTKRMSWPPNYKLESLFQCREIISMQKLNGRVHEVCCDDLIAEYMPWEDVIGNEIHTIRARNAHLDENTEWENFFSNVGKHVLRKVDLSDSFLSAQTICLLSTFSQLAVLNISFIHNTVGLLTEHHLMGIANICSLQSLLVDVLLLDHDYGVQLVSDAFMEKCAENLTQLSKLEVNAINLTRRGISALSRLPLTHLSLLQSQNIDSDLVPFCLNLISCNLYQCLNVWASVALDWLVFSLRPACDLPCKR